VTTHERQQAARLTAAGDVKPPTIGFGTHLPTELLTAQHTSPAAAAATAVAAAAAAAGGGSGGQVPVLQLHSSSSDHQAKKAQLKQKNYSILESELAEVGGQSCRHFQ
jgi:hypothetical protein